MLASLLALLIAGQQPSWQQHRVWRDEARAAAGECDDPALDLPPMRGINHRVEARRLVAAMLMVDPARCPGVREAALRQIQARLGTPERGEVDLELLELAWRAAEEGRGMAPDPALADRYGRMLWLFDDHPPPLPRWPERARRAWLERPRTVALLAAHNDQLGLRTRRSLEAEGLLRLRRGRPYYAPRRGAELLEDGRLAFNMENRLRVSRLFTDGVHLPRDYARAARPFLMLAALRGEIADAPQSELLRIGRLAAAAARTPEARAIALRILFAAALDGRHGSGEALAAILARIGPAPERTLAPGDAERIAAVMTREYQIAMPYSRDDEPAQLTPIGLRALIGPDGHVAFVQLTARSGAPLRDRAVLAAWAEHAASVDLSATAAGRFVWVALPPVEPRPRG